MTIARRRFTGSRRSAGMRDEAVQAYWVAKPGDKVMTREGFAGRVDDMLEGPQGGNEIYLVTLDAGMGGGEYGPAEIQPMSQARGAMENTAAIDYPELADILAERPPPEDHRVLGAKTAATYYLDTPESLALQDWASSTLQASNNAMLPVEVPDGSIEDGTAHDIALAEAGEIGLHAQPESHASGVTASEQTYLMPPEFETEVTVDENGDRHIVGVNCPNPQHYEGDGLNPLVWDWANGYQHYDGSIGHEDGTSVSENVNTLARDSGFADWMTRQFIREPKPGEPGYTAPGAGFSYDWCRYRRNSHCFYPKTLNEAASKQAGYAVWVPFDRGGCGRITWEQQQHCPVGQPGPHVPGGFIDATIPWEQGGQHGGTPGVVRNYAARIDPEFVFHFTSAWRDVRAKAKRIAKDGHVRIIRVPGNEGMYLVAEVQGDNDIYQTAITRLPGKYAVAMWECGCAWSSYSWGRTGRWKRFEGRMCSHALALYYEAQRQEMFGGEMQSARFAPNWRDPSILPKTHYDKAKGRSLASVEAPDADEPTFEETAPAVTYSVSMLNDGVTPQAVMNHLATLGVSDAIPVLRQAMAVSFPAIWRGKHVVVTVDRSGIHVNGEPVSGDEVINPNFDPRRGLSPRDAALRDDRPNCPACGGSGEQGTTGYECYACDGSGQGDAYDPTIDNANPENGLLVGIDQAHGVEPVVAGQLCPVCSGQDESAQHTCLPMTGTTGGLDPKMAPGPLVHPDHDPRATQIADGWIPNCSCGWTGEKQPPDGAVMAHLMAVKHAQEMAEAAGYPTAIGSPPHPDQLRYSKHEPGNPDQAKDFEGPTHGGVVLKAADTGRVLMLQRCLDDGTKEEDPAAGKWEFPGGGFEDGDETSLHGALREFAEEVGHPVPKGGHISHVWRSPDGVYVGHVLVVPSEKDLPLHEPRAEDNPDDPDGDNSEQVAWWHLDDAKKNPALRDEVKDTPWADLKKAAFRQPLTDFISFAASQVGVPYWWDQREATVHEAAMQCSNCGASTLGYQITTQGGTRSITISAPRSRGKVYCKDCGQARVNEMNAKEGLPPTYRDHKQGAAIATTDEARDWDMDPALRDDPSWLADSPEYAAAKERFAQGVMDEFAFVGELNDEPEPALPTTDGDGEDADPDDPNGTPGIADVGEYVGPATDGVIDPTVQPTDGAVSIEGDVAGISSRAWLMNSGGGAGGDPSNNEIAAAAKAHLAKQALKDFTPAQQKELIEEGMDAQASNLDLLDITGTHYEALEAKLRATDPTDDEVLFS